MASTKFTLPVWEEWRKLTEFFALSDHLYTAQADVSLALAEARRGSGRALWDYQINIDKAVEEILTGQDEP